MFIELIATFAMAFAAAGMVLALNVILRGRLPKWVMPVAAGAAMIGYTVWSEYSWYGRTLNSMPEGLTVISTNENNAIFRPWTYVKTYIDKFSAVDVSNRRLNEAVPDQVMTEVFVFGRWAPTARIPILLDCAGKRRTYVNEQTEFDENGAVKNAEWQTLGENDPVIEAICNA